MMMSSDVVVARPGAIDVTQQLANLNSRGVYGLTLQAYAWSLHAQPRFASSANFDIAKLTTEANGILQMGQEHAKLYLNVVLPALIKTANDMPLFLTKLPIVFSALTPASTAQEVLAVLSPLQDQLADHLRAANAYQTDLSQLRDGYQALQKGFSRVNVNAASLAGQHASLVNGLQAQVEQTENHLDNHHIAIASSLFAIVTGAVLVVIGSVLTGGVAAPPLIAGGVGLLVSNVGGLGGSSVGYFTLMKKKRELLGQIQQYSEYASVLGGIASGTSTLANHASSASQAAQFMVNTWQFLADELQELSNTLGRSQSLDERTLLTLRTLAGLGTDQLKGSMNAFKKQMTGVERVEPEPGETLDQHAERHLQRLALGG